MIYEFAIGTGTAFFLMFLWILLMKPTGDIIISFKNQTPSSFMNTTVNQTIIHSEYDIAGNVTYFSMFFIVLIIFIWIVKKAVEYQRLVPYGG